MPTAARQTASSEPAIAPFHAPHAPDDDKLVQAFARKLELSESQERSIDLRATRMIEAIRDGAGSIGGVEDFLREYGLSTREGLALMVLAEALLRVPDARTADAFIEDKLGEGDFRFVGSHPEIGEVRLDGMIDLEQLNAARLDANLGAEEPQPVLRTAAQIGPEQLKTLSFYWFGGD